LDRFDLTNKIEDQQSKIKDVTVMMTDLSDGTDRKLTRNQKRKHDEINHVQKVNSQILCFNTFSVLRVDKNLFQNNLFYRSILSATL
jgi:hypothetical protein